MKKFILALLLITGLAPRAHGGTGWYISPTGGGDGTSAASPQTDTWMLNNVEHGDTVYVADGTYNNDWTFYWRGGQYPDRLTIVGNLADPGAVHINGDITLPYYTDYNGHYAHNFITIKGFRCNSITINSDVAGSGPARQDSIAYFIADSSFGATLHDTCVVMNGTIGSNGLENLFNIGKADSPTWSYGNTYKDLQIYCGLNNQSGNNLVSFRRMYGMTLERVRSFPILWSGVAAGNHTGFFASNQYCNITDCYWFPTNNGPGQKYALNCREDNVGNTWVRDTIIANPASTSDLKIEFQTSGTLGDAAHGNTYSHCYFKPSGDIGYQHGSNYDLHEFNQYIYHGPFFFSSSTDTMRYITFRHNTFLTDYGEVVSSPDSAKLVNGVLVPIAYRGDTNKFVSNLFITGSLASGPHLNVGWWAGAGTLDSNLVAAMQNDSTRMYDYDYNHVGNHWAGGALRGWGKPIYDFSYATANLRPDSTSLAVSSDLWPDGYVGAIAPGTAPTSVFILTEADGIPQAYLNTAFTFTLLARLDNPPDTWAVTAGALPAGLSLGEFTGAISGTPTESGDFDVTIQVTDDQLFTASKVFHINVSPNSGPIRPKHPGFH